jgi:hypothetical protein
MRFRAQLDFARNRRCQPICFVSLTVSNNFSSACYSCREYQTAIIRFLKSHFLEQTASRLPIWHCSRTESYRSRQPHLQHRQVLGRRFASKVISYPPPQAYLGAKYLGVFLVSVLGSHLPRNRFLWKAHWRARRLNLPACDTMSICYSSQE